MTTTLLLDNTMIPCWLVHLLLLAGPTVAWLYALVFWIMYSMAHECSWSSKLPFILGRTSWFVAAIGCSMGLCLQPTVAAVLPLCILFTGGSAVLCYWTRVYHVVGVAQAPYFGPKHLARHNVLITGANSGIGKEATIQLARMGATVYLLCRSTKRAQEALEDILQKHSDDISRTQLRVVAMDLADYASIRKAVQEEFAEIEIHVLINNAGLMMGTKTLTKDGHELMMQANHLGHYLLTRLLLDQNRFAKNARILNVTSSTYQLVTTSFDFDDTMCERTRPYTLFGQYAQTKLANILFTKELAKRYSYKVYAVHPGLVRTNVTSHMPWLLQFLNQVFAGVVASCQKIPAQGAYSLVLCAASPTPPPSASYICNCQVVHTLTKAAESPEDAKRLWIVSEKLVGGINSKQ